MIQHPLKSQGQEVVILEARDKYKKIDTKPLLVAKQVHNSVNRVLLH